MGAVCVPLSVLFRLSICTSESSPNPQHFRLCRRQDPVGTEPQKNTTAKSPPRSGLGLMRSNEALLCSVTALSCSALPRSAVS